MKQDKFQHSGIKGMRWGIRRYQNKDGSLTPAGKKRYADDAHDDYNKAHDKKDVKYMSDAELKARNNRLQMERQYKNFTSKKTAGKQLVDTFVSTAGLITAVTGAYAVYKKLGVSCLDKIGDYVVKGINLSGHLTK